MPDLPILVEVLTSGAVSALPQANGAGAAEQLSSSPAKTDFSLNQNQKSTTLETPKIEPTNTVKLADSVSRVAEASAESASVALAGLVNPGDGTATAALESKAAETKPVLAQAQAALAFQLGQHYELSWSVAAEAASAPDPHAWIADRLAAELVLLRQQVADAATLEVNQGQSSSEAMANDPTAELRRQGALRNPRYSFAGSSVPFSLHRPGSPEAIAARLNERS